MDLENTVGESAALGASGVIMWGATNDYKSKVTTVLWSTLTGCFYFFVNIYIKSVSNHSYFSYWHIVCVRLFPGLKMGTPLTRPLSALFTLLGGTDSCDTAVLSQLNKCESHSSFLLLCLILLLAVYTVHVSHIIINTNLTFQCHIFHIVSNLTHTWPFSFLLHLRLTYKPLPLCLGCL